MKNQHFVFFFWFVDWKSISLGVSFNAWPTHIEIHLPFGFIKFGMDWNRDNKQSVNWDVIKWRQTNLKLIAVSLLMAAFIYMCATACSNKSYSEIRKYQQAKKSN